MEGSSVRALRMRLGYTQRTLSDLLGVHVLTVSRWERETLAPTPDAIRLLEAVRLALDLDPDRLPERMYALRDEPLRALAAVLSTLHPDVAAESLASRADAEAILAKVRDPAS